MLLYELFSVQDLSNVEATLQSLILLDPGSMADPLSTTAFAYEADPATDTDQQLMVTMGSSHPFALWFPGRVQPTAAVGGTPGEVTSSQDPWPAGVSVRKACGRSAGFNGHSQALAG